MLEWIPPPGNVFASNRVKDIRSIGARILEQFKIECRLRFIQTTLNPADLLTRGLPYNTFITKMSFWKHGPEFIQKIPIDWSSKTIGCLSERVKTLLSCSAVAISVVQEPILPIDKYSSLDKLFRVTSLVYQFVNKLKRIKTDI